MLTVICAWCGAVISQNPNVIPGGERISHGLCTLCEALPESERDQIAEVKTREREAKKNESKTGA